MPRSVLADYESQRTGKRKTLAVLGPGSLPRSSACRRPAGASSMSACSDNGGGVTLQLEGEQDRKTYVPGKDPYEEIARVTGKASSTPRSEGDSITDVFVRYADLKGQSVAIAPSDQRRRPDWRTSRSCASLPSRSSWSGAKRDISPGKHYIYTQDGYQNWNQCNIVKDVRKFSGHPEVEAYSWGIGGSALFYPSRIGTLLGEQDVFPRKLDKAYVDSLRDLIRAGQSPIGVAVDKAHRIGTKIYAIYRMNAEYGPPYDKLFNSRFCREHPQYRIVSGQDGSTSPNLSYAFPEVRKYKLDILREVVQTYDVDGIHLEFLRNPPYFGYERPLGRGLREGVRPQYPFARLQGGCNVVQVPRPVHDRLRPRVAQYSAQEGLKNGKRLWLGARVDWSEYLRQGLDVEAWIKEGLIDMLAAGVNGLGYPYAPADEFVQMAKVTACKIYGSTSPEGAGYRDPSPEDDKTGFRFYPKSTSASLDMRRRRYLEYFKRGAQGMYLFNDGGSYLGEFNHLERWGEFEDPMGFHVEPIKRD